MKYYGLEHPNPQGRAGGAKRNVGRLRGGAVHIAVIAPSTISAEAVARYQSTQTSTYSGYHGLFDMDGHLPYFPDDRIAYGARGGNIYGKYNEIMIHLSGACNVDTWVRYVNWSELTYGHMAPEIRRLHETYGWPYRVLTKSEFDRGLLGFTTHHRLDPARRSDPGAIVDGKGGFDFEYLFGLSQGDTPVSPVPRPEEDEMKDLRQGDTGSAVRQLQHLINGAIYYTNRGFEHLNPDGVYGPTTAARAQHAIWRAEGWVLGYPLYAEEDGGSRISVGTMASLYDVYHGLRLGIYDLDPTTDVSQSGVDFSDAQKVAEWVRENVRVEALSV